MADLPTGSVSFLFTDIEGSTRLLAALGPRYATALEAHHRILREAIAASGGLELATQGDSFFAVFTEPMAAVTAAVAAQRRLAAETWPEGRTLRVRMGVHTGEATLGGDNYVGLSVHRAARIADAAHGGQVLLSEPAAAEVRDALPDDLALRELGEHWLRDLEHPEPLTQLVIEGLPGDFPPLRAAARRPTNLPAELTSFVGRNAERVRLARTLEEARLVTLVGPGGSGKTRLALRVAADQAPLFADGAAFVALEAVADAELLPSAVASAIGLRADPAEPIADAVVAELRPRRLLLVLDNLEQVVGAAPFVATLLGEARELRVLATSRVPLHVPGERTVLLAPLEVPDPRQLPDLAVLAAVESVALFVARARDADSSFSLAETNAEAVAAICARLDGLPLAIELAAARIRILTPEAMLARFERPLSMLGAAGADAPERQRTLRGAIEWSHDLLDEPERALFRRLSVCAGGCDLSAAETIGGEIGADVLDALASLVEKSLVRRVDRLGEPHFAMLATIREFASERLGEDGDEERATRRRHADHWLSVVEHLIPQLDRGTDAALRLADEQENLRAALRFTLSADAAAEDRLVGLRLALALAPFWVLAAPREGSEWLARAIALLDGSNLELEGRIYFYSGVLLDEQSRAAEAEACLQQGLERFRRLEDRHWQARLLNSLGGVIRARGETAQARALLEESLALRRELGDDSSLGAVLSNLALVDIDEGNLAAGREHLEASLAVDRRFGNQDGIATGLGNLAEVALRAGDPATAEPLIGEALRRFARLGDLLGVAGELEHAAEAAARRSHDVRAARLFGVAEALRMREGLHIAPVELARHDRIVAEARSALGEAAYAEAFAAGCSMRDEEAIAEALAGLPGAAPS